MQTEEIDNKILFKSLPLVGPEFNYISIDLLLIDTEEELFTVLIRYMIVENEEIQAGLTLQTGMSANGFDNIVREVAGLLKTGIFDLQEVCGTGTFYDQENKEFRSIDWNEELMKIAFIDEDNKPSIKLFH